MIRWIGVLAAAWLACATQAYAGTNAATGSADAGKISGATIYALNAGHPAGFNMASFVGLKPPVDATRNTSSYSNIAPAQAAAGSAAFGAPVDAPLLDGDNVRKLLHFSEFLPAAGSGGYVNVFAAGPGTYFDPTQVAGTGGSFENESYALHIEIPEPGIFGIMAAGVLIAVAVARRKMR